MVSPISLKVGVRLLLFCLLYIQPCQPLFCRRQCGWSAYLVAPVNQPFRSQALSLPPPWMRSHTVPLLGHRRKRERQPSSGAWSSEDDTSSGAWDAPRRRKTTCKATQACPPHAQPSTEGDTEYDSGAWSDSDHDSGAWSDCEYQSGIPPPPRIEATGIVDGSDLLGHALCRVGNDTTYSKEGRCRTRIRTLLATTHSSSACMCKAPCFMGLSVGMVGAVADAYWSMSDEERSVIIHSMYTAAACNSEGHLQKRRITWKSSTTVYVSRCSAHCWAHQRTLCGNTLREIGCPSKCLDEPARPGFVWISFPISVSIHCRGFAAQPVHNSTEDNPGVKASRCCL